MSRATTYTVEASAAWITLARPERRNALSDELVHALREDVERALLDPQVRVLVLTGAGAAFCAGADLAKPAFKATPDELTPFSQLLLDLWTSPKVVMAAVNGAAYGGGLGLVAAADIAIAAPEARFAFSEVRLGVAPAIISVLCLRKMAPCDASYLFLTGERFGPETARASGLLQAIAGENDLYGAVTQELARLRLGAPGATAAAKSLLRDADKGDVRSELLRAQMVSAKLFASAEAAEGASAFRERRAPSWAQDA